MTTEDKNKTPKKNLASGKLGALIAPHLKVRAEGKAHNRFDYVRGFISCPKSKLGEGFSRRMNFARESVWDLAFYFYDLLDAGKGKEAWGIAFAIAAQYGKIDDAQNEVRHEMRRRMEEGDNMARKLLDYAGATGLPVIWIRWSNSLNRVRVEHYHEAAERHLRAICLAKNEEVAGSYRSFRESMVRHGFFDAARGKVITDAARKEREEKVKAAKKKAKTTTPKPNARKEKRVEGGLAGLGAALEGQKPK